AEDGATFAAGASADSPKPPNPRGAEFRWKDMTADERRDFEQADLKEWQATLPTGAVRVLSREEPRAVRRRHPGRILSSRMVRRKKPVEGVGKKPVAKSRWCAHGHQDPDGESLRVYAPTPQTESAVATLQAIVSHGWALNIADAKNAFCPSEKLKRPSGAIFVEPCQGLPLSADQLIELVAPVYGLNDAPLLWHRTLTEYLATLGFQKSMLEPCLWLKRDRWGALEGLILIEVDDLIVAGTKEIVPGLRKSLTSRFHFGKWQESEADYGGRHFKQYGDRMSIDPEKYIREQLSVLQPQGQPSAMPHPTVADGLMLVKICRYLKATASQRLTVWALDLQSLLFVTASDAGGPGSAKRGGAQGARLVLAADSGIRNNARARVSLLSWRSQRLKRVVASTVAAETLFLSSAVAEAQWLQVLWRDSVHGDAPRPDWHQVAAPSSVILSRECSLGEKAEALSVVDAKSAFDTLSRNTAGSRADRRNFVELAVARDSVASIGHSVRWPPHGRMPADPLAHADPGKGNLALHDLLRRGALCLVDEGGRINERAALNLSLKSRSRGASRKALMDE
ncbi:unnamed protein product, partial [Prorocentrum cordatum]